jgi:hypothetical protein
MKTKIVSLVCVLLALCMFDVFADTSAKEFLDS